MKTRIIIRFALALALSASTFTPARAADPFPMPPEPKWWKQTGITDVRYGIWLPCDVDWQITNDCTQSIKLIKEDGSEAGDLTYEKNPKFNPANSSQEWITTNSPDGTAIENTSEIVRAEGSVRTWKLPAGITTTNGSSEIMASVHLMNSSLQIYATAADMLTASLPEGYYFQFTLKSSGFAKRIKWVLSNIRDPQVSVAGDLITVKGLPENSPAAKNNEPVCEPNLLKASSTQRNMAVNLIYWDAGNRTTDTRPDDVILGTNGWWCLSDFHFDRQNQQIVVKVGNVHFDEFGNEIQGWMELKVKGTRAREWWGIDPAIAAGYAKVEVSYQDGTKKVATVSAKYDSKNDWINLRAYGFTYSSPQLAVSFKKPVEATKTVAPKKSTINCVKGKTTKKVTGTSPKCPAGYKKK